MKKALLSILCLGLLYSSCYTQTLTPKEIFQTKAPSVVEVETYPIPADPFILFYKGTGFLYRINEQVEIVTAGHMFEKMKSFYAIVKFKDGRTLRVESKDVQSILNPDVAVLRIGSSLTWLGPDPLNIASEDPAIGEQLITIGNPHELNWIQTVGFVSAYTTQPSVTGSGPERYLGAQIGIARGNSGGPLFTMDGTVVGLCSWGYAEGDLSYLNFFVPGKEILREVQLLNKLWSS